HAHPRWTDVVTALVRLVDYLDNTEVPIDYQRRRLVDYRRLLTNAEWHQRCRDAHVRPGLPIRGQIARCILFERLSGLPVSFAPFSTGLDTAAFRQKMNRFLTTLTPDLADALHASAAHFLARHGLGDEPVSRH